MNEIKNEKNIINRRVNIDNVPANYLESITYLDFIEYNIREHKSRIFYIPITAEAFNRYDLTETIFIKFPFSPECFYREEDNIVFKDDNMVNVFVELLFDNNKTTQTTKEKIKNLKTSGKSIGNNIIGYIELKFDCRKLKEYRFPKPLSFKFILNNKIEKENNPNIIKITSNDH